MSAAGLRSIEGSLPLALLRTREAVMARFRPHVARHGVTEQQWRVIRVLAAADEALEAGTIAERACIMPPSLSRILKTLEQKKLVRRAKAADDARRLRIALTEQGRALFNAVSPGSEALYREIEAAFGKEDLAALMASLGRLRDALERPARSGR